MEEVKQDMVDAKTIELDCPVVRGETVIKSVTVRKPKAGELRGIKLMELASMDVGALIALLPRITMPSLLKHEVEQMDPADITDLGVQVALFLAKKQDQMAFQ